MPFENEQRADYDRHVSPCKKKRKQIHVMAGGRLHADQKVLPWYRHRSPPLTNISTPLCPWGRKDRNAWETL